MEYVIGVILVIIVLIIIALLFRKRLYDQLDYYEGWKIDIMGRNVAAKLTRIKSLNIAGETKERLEGWKKEWDNILMKDLADVEEVLFDSEQATDRFRIPTARKHLGKLENMLVGIEQKIERIDSETEQLLKTEKKNRQEIEQLKPRLEELRKKLSQERFSFERVAITFEHKLDDIEEDIHIYNDLITVGSYSEASDIVGKIKEKLSFLEVAMTDFPELYNKCKTVLPNRLDEVYANYKELEASGYHLEPLHITKSIHDYQSRLLDYVLALENLETDEVKDLIPETEEQIMELFKQLENEVIAKNFVDSKSVSFAQSLKRLLDAFAETKEEVELLKKTYHFADDELGKYMTLEKQIEQLYHNFKTFKQLYETNENTNSDLRNDLTAYISQLETLEQEHEQYKQQITNLRKDELEAHEQINWMTEELNHMKRKLRQSNLPGIPNFILAMLDEATNKNEHVLTVIEKQPLDIPQVQKTLKEAKSTVENVLNQTNRLIEQAQMTEIVIQYANRYRSRDPILAAKLLEAEQL